MNGNKENGRRGMRETTRRKNEGTEGPGKVKSHEKIKGLEREGREMYDNNDRRMGKNMWE